MSKQVVLITGALTGIGRATAMAFAAAGADVVVAGRREEDGKMLEKQLRELGAEAEFVKVDVRHEPELQSLVDDTVKRFGRLDVAVNNAGTDGAKGPVTSQTPETYASTFETNVLGVLPSMGCCPRARAASFNISSVPGHAGVAGHALYAAGKQRTGLPSSCLRRFRWGALSQTVSVISFAVRCHSVMVAVRNYSGLPNRDCKEW